MKLIFDPNRQIPPRKASHSILLKSGKAVKLDPGYNEDLPDELYDHPGFKALLDQGAVRKIERKTKKREAAAKRGTTKAPESTGSLDIELTDTEVKEANKTPRRSRAKTNAKTEG